MDKRHEREALHGSGSNSTLDMTKLASIEAEKNMYELKRPGRKTDIHRARAVLLGESHTDISHIAINAEIIRSVVKHGDIILVEGAKAFQDLEKDTHKVTRLVAKDVVVRGWDDMDRLHEVVEKQKKNFAVEKEFKEAKKNWQWDMIPVLGGQLELLEHQKQDIMIRQRNESLIQTIDATHRQFPEKRIFAIVGYSHLDDPGLSQWLDKNHSYMMFKPPLREASDEE